MKFITEEDLRYSYMKNPFDRYEIEAGARLTPGARQFLADRGINVFEDGSYMQFGSSPAVGNAKSDQTKSLIETERELTIEKLEIEFLMVGQELYDTELTLARKIFQIESGMARLREGVKDQNCYDCDCKPAAAKPRKIELEHLEKSNGRTVVLLYKLKNSVELSRIALNKLTPEGDERQNMNLIMDDIIVELTGIIDISLGGN